MTVARLAINKILIRFLVYFSFCFLLSSCVCQKSLKMTEDKTQLSLIGKFKKINGTEILILNKDQSFLSLRNSIQKNDVVVFLCDTLASGFWRKRKSFITLKNKNNFNKIDYSITESEIKSKDSLYFNIILPHEYFDNYQLFNYIISTRPLYGQINISNKPEFSISKKSENMTFSLVLKNIVPNCDIGVKCYQRIYFNIFENYLPQIMNSNSFTITLKNFNQCFYEKMDIDGELIGFEGDTLFWRGNEYIKIE
ncbi:MAG: hypothetical protein WAU24_09680 [Chitinophagaceae bacterium]